MVIKYYITTQAFRDKQKLTYINNGKNLSKMCHKNNIIWKIENSEIICYMKCKQCLVYKERIIDNFKPDHINKNINNWFDCEAGTENFSRTCKICISKNNKEKYKNEYNYLYSLFKRYKNLELNVLFHKWNTLEYGLITGIPKKYIIPSVNHFLSPGIHDIICIHKENNTKYNQLNHDINYINIDLDFVNIAQGTKIKNLKNVYLSLYENEIEGHNTISNFEYCQYILDWFKKSVNECGISHSNLSRKDYVAQCRKLHLNSILRLMVADHKKHDKRKNRTTNNNITKEYYLQLLIDNDMKCSVSKIKLTIQKNLFTDVSFDRINNNLPHEIGNIRPVCYALQLYGDKHVTRKDFLHMCLVQNLYPMNDIAYNRILNEHNNILNDKCSFCEIDNLPSVQTSVSRIC